MKRILMLICAIFLMFTAALYQTAIASDQIASGPVVATTGYYFCAALEDPTPATAKGRAFYSGVFQAYGNGINLVREAYVKFLQEKYQYAQDPTTFNTSVQCTGTNSAEEATTIEGYRVAPGKRLNPEGTFETGWTVPLEASKE